MSKYSEWYRRKQAEARDKAIEWQLRAGEMDYSYGELYYWNCYFAELGRRYGLYREFKENGII